MILPCDLFQAFQDDSRLLKSVIKTHYSFSIDLFIIHDKYCYNFVVPAKAGTQAIFKHPRRGTTLGFVSNAELYANWIPASAGMTTTSNEYAVIIYGNLNSSCSSGTIAPCHIVCQTRSQALPDRGVSFLSLPSICRPLSTELTILAYR